MKTLLKILSIAAFLSVLLCLSGCSEDNTGSGPQVIPLDGRGGGVIIYCYQGDGLHKIYGINADGTGNKRMITASIGLNHHDISADGQRIACVGYIDANFNTWSIHVFNIDGTGLTRLTTTNNVEDSEPVWSPDGSRIAFTRIYPNQNNKEELWLMNADGSNQHYIGVEGFAAKWSPNGTRFIYSSNKSGNYEIYTCQIDGTNEQRLTNTSEDETFPCYSPDGTRIAFCASSGVYNTPGNAATYVLYTMNSDGSNILQLTNNNFMDAYPRWSLDGTRFVFESDRHQTDKWEIYIMNVDGSNVRRITNSPSGVTGINPVWRP
jgi:TolB protein